MPISKDEWNKGRTLGTVESMIETFLKADPKKAYTESEIIGALYSVRFNTMLDWMGAFGVTYAVSEALKNLLKSGVVKSRVVKESIGESIFYCIG
jgi:hypothetical protein